MKKILFLLLIVSLTAFGQRPEIHSEVIVNAPVSDVYNAWTTTEGIKTFFAPGGNIELKPNGFYEIYMLPEAEPGQRGADSMRVMAFEKDKMLAFTWNAPPYFPELRHQLTHVQIFFEPAGENKTKVTFIHDGFGTGPEWKKLHEYFTNAWTNVILPRLKQRFDEGPVDWSKIMNRKK